MAAEPEFRLAFSSKARSALDFYHKRDTQRRERRGEKFLAPMIVANGQAKRTNGP